MHLSSIIVGYPLSSFIVENRIIFQYVSLFIIIGHYQDTFIVRTQKKEMKVVNQLRKRRLYLSFFFLIITILIIIIIIILIIILIIMIIITIIAVVRL